MNSIIKRSASVFLAFIILSTTIGQSYVSAIYYGTKSSKLQQSGYIILDFGNGESGQCGINYVSPTVGVTAAHCLEGVSEVYAGVGNFSQDYKSKAPKVDYFEYSPQYNETTFSYNPGLGDVGVVVFDEPVNLSEYGLITEPQIGCDYFMIGYGRNQNGATVERYEADVCIKNISTHSFELTFSGNTHFCEGDSGSGIYKKGTNNLVGVSSAYYNRIGFTGCDNAVTYVVARLDDNIDFLDDHLPNTSYSEEMGGVEETVPQDYFGEFYPETQNEDGGFNYENEILIEIEKLSELFKNIYPDDEESDDPVNEDDDYVFNPEDYDSETEEEDIDAKSSESETSSDSTNSNTIVFIIFTSICCIFFSGILGIVFLLLIFKLLKK